MGGVYIGISLGIKDGSELLNEPSFSIKMSDDRHLIQRRNKVRFARYGLGFSRKKTNSPSSDNQSGTKVIFNIIIAYNKRKLCLPFHCDKYVERSLFLIAFKTKRISLSSFKHSHRPPGLATNNNIRCTHF